MKKNLYKYILPLIALVAVVVIIPRDAAHAQSLFGIPSISDLVEQVMAWFMNQLVALMSLFLTITGYLLNFSINLTLQIKSFVDSTPAIYTTWRTIRDIAGLAMIFFLLYAAFQLITGIERPKFGDLIKNIVVAGILINFSFFFAGLGIDASNIVSVQIYNAIAPANSLNPNAAKTNLMNSGWASTYDGGLSDIFMQSLQIQKVYKQKLADYSVGPGANGVNSAVAGGVSNAVSVSIASAPVKIFLMGAVAVLIMFCAAMSFGAAALAFILRFVILILLLAFSPVWMLGFLPEVGAYTKKWKDMYKSMLIFMPVYLLLMYVALSILTTSPMFGGGLANNVAATPGNAPGQTTFIERALAAPGGAQDGSWYSSFLVLGVNSAIVIVLLNMPLAAAASIAGGTIGLLKKAEGKFGYGQVFGKAAGSTSSFIGSNTIGKAAANLDKALDKTKLGNSLLARDIRGATTGALAKSTFGGDRSAKDYKDEAKKTRVKIEEVERRDAFNANLKAFDGSATAHAALKTSMGKLNEKDKLDLGAESLQQDHVIRYLKKSDFDAIKKSDEFTDSEKAAIADKRKQVFENAINTGDTNTMKDMIKHYSGEDLLGIDQTLLDDEEMLKLYNVGHLKSIDENSNDRGLKQRIKTVGLAMGARGIHVATEGWLRKMDADGLW